MKTAFLFLMLLILFRPAFSQNASKIADFEKQPKVAWKFKTTGPLISTPVVDDKTVYFGSLDSGLYALDKSNGSVRWTFGTYGKIRSTVCLDGDKLYLLSGDGNLYCINKNSGQEIWHFRTATGYMGDRTNDWADYYHSSPVIYNGIVYFGSGDGHVYAVKSTTGEFLWSFETGGVVHTVPFLQREKLFIGSFDGHLYALNNQTGQLIWKFKSTGQLYFPKGEVMGNPVAAGNIVFAGARDFNFYAIDVNGGYCRWMKTFPRGWALPVTPNDSVIYLGTSDDRELLALDARTGNVLWKSDAKFNIFGGLARSSSMGYFGTLMGKLQGIDLKTGAVKWTFSVGGYDTNRRLYFKEDDSYRDDIGTILGTGDNVLQMYYNLGAIFSTPAVTDDAIYLTSADGHLYCLKRP